MTINEFNKYKKTCNKILSLLYEEGYKSIRDVYTILKILSGFPYCLDTEGHYVYEWEYYNSMNDMPQKGIKELLYYLEHNNNFA